MRILIVEDEIELAKILLEYLEKNHYEVEILSSGHEAVEKILNESWDLVLLDLMLPGKDGLEICSEVRKDSQIPIIMLTARVEEVDRLVGLKLGADDYVCKPYSPREVVARVDAVLRRAGKNTEAAPLISPGIVVDSETMEVVYGKERIELTTVEFNLAQALLRRPIRICSRNDLMDLAYSDNRIVNDRTIDSHINKLRRKIKTVTGEDNIRSVYGAGYRIELN